MAVNQSYTLNNILPKKLLVMKCTNIEIMK